MPSNEIDELYVTLKFREELGDAVEDIDDRVDDLERSFERSMGSAQSETEDTTRDIGDLQDEVDTLRRKLKRLDNQDASPDVDVDRDGGRRRGGRNVPTDVDEIAEGAIEGFMNLSPRMKALAAAAGSATVALGAATGLAGAATVLAAKFGDSELRGAIDRLQAKALGVATTFVSEFEPVIRGTVIPTLSTFADDVAGASDDLRAFTEAVLQPDQKTLSDARRTRINAAARAGASGVSVNAQPRLGSQMGFEQTGVMSFEISEEQKGLRNRWEREVIEPALQEIRKVRARAGAGFITDEEEVKQIRDIRREMYSTLKAKQMASDIDMSEVDLITGDTSVTWLEDFLAKAREAQQRLEQLKAEAFAEKGSQMAAENAPTPFRTGAPEGAGPGTDDLGQQVQNLDLAGQRMQAIQYGWKQTVDAQEQSNRKIAQGIRLGSQLGATLIQAAQGTEQEWNRVLGQVLGTIGSIVGIANPAVGAGIAGAGTLIGSFDQGGFTGMGAKGDVAGIVHRGEYVMPKDVVQTVGVGAMRRIHQMGSMSGYATGGLVGQFTNEIGSGQDLEALRKEVRALGNRPVRVYIGGRAARDIQQEADEYEQRRDPQQQ